MQTPKKRNEQSRRHNTGVMIRKPVRKNEPLEPAYYPSQLDRYYSRISRMSLEQEAEVFGGNRLIGEVMDELEAEERRAYEEENRLIPPGYPTFDDYGEIDNALDDEM